MHLSSGDGSACIGGERMTYQFIFSGQIRGGKNNIQITRTGHRFPTRAWSEWLADTLPLIEVQRLKQHIKEPMLDKMELRVDYYSEDNRRRDCTALLDAIFHVLEKAGIVKDDAQFKIIDWTDHGKVEGETARAEVYMDKLPCPIE